MAVPVIWLTRHAEIQALGPWDTKILWEAFTGELWVHPWAFDHHRNVFAIPEGLTRAIVVLPARHHVEADDIDWLNRELGKLKSAILILAGDEEGTFPWKAVRHDHCRFWVQHPHPVLHNDMRWAFFYGCGDPQSRFDRYGALPEKTTDWFFSGQVTHKRREEAVNGLIRARSRTRGELHTTSGFRQGMSPQEFEWNLRKAKVAPCPGGPFTPDTFRFYEALDAGCVPIVDSHSPDTPPGYWQLVYGDDFPFPIIDDWDGVGGHIEPILRTWPVGGSQAAQWWVGQRRKMVERLNFDLISIGFDQPEIPWWQQVTIVCTTSPVPSNPATDNISFTLESIRESMGLDVGQEIPTVIACDGVRFEQSEMANDYHDFVNQLAWYALGSNHIQVVVAPQHLHQQKLTWEAMKAVTTPLILFVEHDTPFNADAIDWPTAVDAMLYGSLDVLRFHHEQKIQEEHRYLMTDHFPTHTYGLPVLRTRQWSQRPHLARSDYYRRMLSRLLDRPGNGFIEDAQYSEALQHPLANRIGIYAPEGGLCRTFHTDGRAGGPKFDDVLMP